MDQQYTKKSGFSLSWPTKNVSSTEKSDGFFAMRDWQVRAFEQLKNVPYMILNAPMGSGKSWLMCALSAFKMKRDASLKCVIAVPQTIIAPGFIHAKLQMPDGEQIEWYVKHNLCSQIDSKGTVNYFIAWLSGESDSLSERVIVCTHATLVAAFKKLKSEKKLHFLSNVLVWIDEAHHVKNVAVDGFDGTINNGLGELVSYLSREAHSDVQIGLTTASFFRGDRASLLTESMESQFTRFKLPYDEYFRSMKYLKSFSYDFLLCGPDYIKGIERVLQEREGKDIIYIPHPVSQYSTGNKHQEVSRIVGTYGMAVRTTEDGLSIIKGQNGERKILDLVSEDKRKPKKNYLENPDVKKHPQSLDGIIALGMFKEGANWIHANRCIIVGARSSLVDVIQMIGRVFRDAEGKDHVEIIQLLPFLLDSQDEDGFRENLNNYVKAIYASLILENILNPVKIKSVQRVEKESDDVKKANAKVDWLNVVLPDDAKQLSLMEEAGNCLLDLKGSNEEAANNIDVLYGEYQKAMSKILEGYGINEHQEEVAQQLWSLQVRRALRFEGISVEDVDFNIIQKIDPLYFLLRYTSGACNIDTFEKLREAINLSRMAWRSFEEARDFVRGLNLKTQNHWYEYSKTLERPKDIPVAPQLVYKKYWKGWGDFLGTGTIASQNRIFLKYKNVREFAHKLQFLSKKEWYEWAKTNARPQSIPADPQAAYAKTGWEGWGDFLGTGTIAPQNREFRIFEEAKKYAQSLGLKGGKEWRELTKAPLWPNDLPTNPNKIYLNDGWKGWGDFLGTGNIAKMRRQFRSFEEACEFVRSLKFKNMREYRAWTKTVDRPLDIPVYPNETYATLGWKGAADWLGKN